MQLTLEYRIKEGVGNDWGLENVLKNNSLGGWEKWRGVGKYNMDIMKNNLGKLINHVLSITRKVHEIIVEV